MRKQWNLRWVGLGWSIPISCRGRAKTGERQQGAPRLRSALLAIFFIGLFSPQVGAEELDYPWLDDKEVTRSLEDLSPPFGFFRIPKKERSFSMWLRGLPLRPDGTPVLLYNGKRKPEQRVHHAVVDMDTGRRNLQQCADAICTCSGPWARAWNQSPKGPQHFFSCLHHCAE